jgi:hypothetical protein
VKCSGKIPLILILLILTIRWDQPASAQTDDRPLVIQISYDSREQLADLAGFLDIWEVNPETDVLIAAAGPAQIERLSALGLVFEIEPLLTEKMTAATLLHPGQVSGIPGYPCYRTVEETYTSGAALAAAHPGLAAWTDTGDSWDKTALGGPPGYDLMALTLTNQQISGDKPTLLITAAIHPREYVTAELALRFAEYLLASYGLDPDVTWILNHHEIHFIFQANPDGRKQAEAGALWRKNTNENYCISSPEDRGADLNRNFSFQWGTAGDSGNPCASNYRGPNAASEPETQNLQDYLLGQFPDQRGPTLTDPAPEDAMGVFIDLHSYGNWVLWPWGFTDAAAAPNHSTLQTLGRKLAFFNNYRPAQASDLYPASGATDDYAYGELGLAAFTFEMGTWFFQDCTTFESTIYPDNLEALLYAARTARAPYQLPSGPDALSLALSQNTVPAGEQITLTAVITDDRYNHAFGAEAVQNISGAAYTLDTPLWETGAVPQSLAPSDGVFDETLEEVTAVIDTIDLVAGRHIIYLHGQDAAGNWGPVSAVFFTVTIESNLFLPLVIQ